MNYFLRSSLTIFIAVLFVGCGGEKKTAKKEITTPQKSKSHSTTSKKKINQPPAIAPTLLLGSISMAADYLSKAVKDNGEFKYVINLNNKIKVRPQYNILRHAGAIYAMATYVKEFPSEDIKLNIIKSVLYLQKTAMKPIVIPGNKTPFIVIWNDIRFRKNKKPSISLGGNGLGLVALCSVEHIAKHTTPLATLRKLGNFILFLQKENGDFYSKYRPGEPLNEKWKSLYYPGEAALGLMMLYQIDSDPKWLSGAKKALLFLAKKREGLTVTEADHWALLATKQIVATLQKNGASKKEIDALLDHVATVANSILNTDGMCDKKGSLHGSFMEDGRTTPTATRCEGLLAALDTLPENRYGKLRNKIHKRVIIAIQYLMTNQVRKGSASGGIICAPRLLPLPSGLGYKVNKKKSSTQIRIDYVQHTLSALLEFQKYNYKVK